MDPKKILELLQKLEPMLQNDTARITVELDNPEELDPLDKIQIEAFLKLAYANFINNLKELI